MIALPFVAFPLIVSATLELTFEGASRHPLVTVSPEDVVRARERIQTDSAAKAWFGTLMESVAAWDDRDPDWVKEVMPGEGACFAYGFTGCPICAAGWGTWGSAKASFDDPGHVVCANGHVLPDADHPDPGAGYVAPDKRIHYFVGSYNAWVVETLTFKVARPCADMYLLTGDERAGRMGAVILDELARIYPSCDKGSWDYPSNPPSGRLNRPWYQVARVLIHYVDIYDRIYHHPALDEPSAVEGLSRRQNIERNLLLNGAEYCYEMSVKSGGLHNGEADYLRGVLAVGVVLGIPEYVTWPVDGTYGIRTMMANNVDRDGRYFETSAGYGLHTRELYLTFSEPLINYRGSAYPGGLNLYDDPRFASFYLLPQMAFVCLGHAVPYGDHGPARDRRPFPYRPPSIRDFAYAERFAVRVSDPSQRAEYAALRNHLAGIDPAAPKQTLEWRIFHAPDEGPADGAELSGRAKRLLESSFFLGQKGFGIIRYGTGESAQAAALRFGPSLVHGHLDDLNVNYFARGYEMTYDIGYSLGSTHTQVGWAKQTASHNTVVVDEKSQGGGGFGGSLHHFADLPGLVLVDADSSVYAHLGVELYRRLFAVTDGYALDIFRVKGGRQHDLPLHGLSSSVSFQGIDLGPPGAGSLAGEEFRWGEMQLNDGDMEGYPNKPYWNPPPGNGYGFLVEPAFATPEAAWSATWEFEDTTITRFQLLPLYDPASRVATALAPGLYPHFPRARHVMRRRAGENLSSCFVSLWQSATQSEPGTARSIRRLDDGGELAAESALAVSVSLADGTRDIWAVTPTAEAAVDARDGDLPISLHGSFAKCRLNGDEVLSIHLLEAESLRIAGWTVTLDSPARVARVSELPGDSNAIPIEDVWPGDGRYDGDPLYVRNPAYSRITAYVVSGISGDRVRVEQTGTVLGKGVVEEVADENTLTTRVPHEYARSVTRSVPTGIFRGKLLCAEDGGASTRIREVVFGDPMMIRVDSTSGFRPGQVFRYHDVQPGDTAIVQHYASLLRAPDGTYELTTNTDVTITAPGARRVDYLDKTSLWKQATGGSIPRSDLPAGGQTTIRLLE